MISVSQEAFETIVATVPDFQPRCQTFLAEWQGEDTPCYLAMGELAHYIVESYEQGDTAQYQELFPAVEHVLQNGEIQNLIWVGLLEDLIAWDEVNRGMQKVAEWAAQKSQT